MRSIAVIMAMEAEASPFLDRISATPIPFDTPLPTQGFLTEIGECRVAVILNGRHPRHMVDHIGTDAAAVATVMAITQCQPELVITAGSAGGRRGTGRRIGDIVVADRWFVHHDRRIPLSGFQDLGIGRFPAVPVDAMIRELDLFRGVISTGNSFGETSEDLAMLNASGAIAIDMESAAVASVCELFGVPVTGVRVLANFIDDGDGSITEFHRELNNAASLLADALVAVVNHCAVRDIGDLTDIVS